MAEAPTTLNGHHAPSVLYEVRGKIALNAIDDTMPALLEQAVQRANAGNNPNIILAGELWESFQLCILAPPQPNTDFCGIHFWI